MRRALELELGFELSFELIDATIFASALVLQFGNLQSRLEPSKTTTISWSLSDQFLPDYNFYIDKRLVNILARKAKILDRFQLNY